MAYKMKDDKKHYTAIPLIRTMMREGANYAVTLGMRKNGKSYSIKEFATAISLGINPITKLPILKPYQEGTIAPRLFYLRRWQEDISSKEITRYFGDVPVDDMLDDGLHHYIKAFGSEIWICTGDEKTGKDVKEYHIGYSGDLNGAEHLKSQFFGKELMIVIYEEVVTNGVYINGMNEPRELLNLVSTVIRNDIEHPFIFLIGNTISQVCPYYRYFGLTNFHRQAQDTREVYHVKKLDGTIVNIIAENARQRIGHDHQSKLFFGQAEDSIVNGAWETQEYPTLPAKYEDCKKLYTIFYKSMDFLFAMELLKCKEGMFIFVRPHTTELRPKAIVISDTFNPSPRYSRWWPNNALGAIYADLYNNCKTCYSDNLTGTNFVQVMANYNKR